MPTTPYMGDLAVQGSITAVGGYTGTLKANAVYATGNVGIGLAPATYQLDLSTDRARKLTTSTWATGSDRRVKENIEDADLQMCLDTVDKIALKRFSWKKELYPQIDDRRVLGFIAQEVQTVMPKSVSVGPAQGIPDFLTLDVDQLYKTLFGATKKLIQRVGALEATLEANGMKLVEPDPTEPVAESAEPAEPVAESAEPVAESAEPVAESAEPTEPVAESAEPEAEASSETPSSESEDPSGPAPSLTRKNTKRRSSKSPTKTEA